jgi:hypothetical protein
MDDFKEQQLQELEALEVSLIYSIPFKKRIL